MRLPILFESGTGVLSSPSNQLLRIWAEAAGFLLIDIALNEDASYKFMSSFQVSKSVVGIEELKVVTDSQKAVGHSRS